MEWLDADAVAIVDYFAPRARLRELLTGVVAYARDVEAAAVRCLTLNSAANRTFMSCGFTRLAGASRTTLLSVHTKDDDPFRTELVDPAEWFITAADSDID
jgi:hypothetical protein